MLSIMKKMKVAVGGVANRSLELKQHSNRPQRTSAESACLPLPSHLIRVKPSMQAHTEEAKQALFRHVAGDWGEISDIGWKANNEALLRGEPLASRYTAKDGTVFWIVTEADRSETVILQPEES